ncbi:MAG: MarR family winged helix-turn-helix transcriptional regulator, partial [Thermodesulfobacteriota bacterium]
LSSKYRYDTIIDMSLTNLLNLIDSIGNLLRSEEKKFLKPLGLLPIHLNVINYLSTCNKYSNNPAALTRYLGNTKGTTSQSVNVLEKKGYLIKEKIKDDKRVVKLYLTDKATDLLNQLSFEDSESFFNDKSIEVSESVLSNILKSLQLSNQNRTFGVCKTCDFFIDEGDGFRCGLTQEKLFDFEIDQICQEHESELHDF